MRRIHYILGVLAGRRGAPIWTGVEMVQMVEMGGRRVVRVVEVVTMGGRRVVEMV